MNCPDAGHTGYRESGNNVESPKIVWCKPLPCRSHPAFVDRRKRNSPRRRGSYSLLPVLVWKPSPGMAFSPTAKLK